MFHKIVLMYRNIQELECNAAAELVAQFAVGIPQPETTFCPTFGIQEKKDIMEEQMKEKEVVPFDVDSSPEISSEIKLMVVPEDLASIRPRSSQVWNCDEIGFDPNGNWNRMICTYNWYPIDQIWRTQTGEHAPFWCTLLVFTRADGQCFMPLVLVHQSACLSKDLLFGVPSDWVVHAMPSGYMDRNG